ncbi:hypothetical protein [Arenibacter palladensis]|uniref:hypothetical protein n=1 Tax=Arenibacter palladensis TaxID=237373 RepID=UPI0026E3CC68|nr:hypothetical protein [Arenibacter palladensis]MDO6604695.1 hypothetical protein [Arenibacter palladensis]
MDYSKLYKTAYDELFKAGENLIKNELQKGIDSNYPIKTILDDISDILYQSKKDCEKEVRTDNIKEIIDQFDVWKKKYSPDTKIESEVNNKLLSFFNKAASDFELNRDYGQFLQLFAHYRAAKDVNDGYHERQLYTEITIGANMVEKYTLVPKGNEWENSEEYNLTKDKMYPDDFKTPDTVEMTKPPEPKKKNNEAIKNFDLIKTFTPRETKFVLSVLFDLTKKHGRLEDSSIPLTEFLKLIVITKETCTIDILYKPASSCAYYNNISQGISVINKNDRPVFINTLSNKLDELNMGNFAGIIREYHTVTIP